MVQNSQLPAEWGYGEQSGGNTQQGVPCAGAPCRAIAGGAAVLGIGALEMDDQADDGKRGERWSILMISLCF